MKRKNNEKGITLIALVVTIIIIIILASVSIYNIISNNGVITKTQEGTEKYNTETAKEKMQFKILAIQIKYGGQATLQQIADELCQDDEVEYVYTESQIASLERVIIGDAESIYIKLIEYEYEFEIDKNIEIIDILNINKIVKTIEIVNISEKEDLKIIQIQLSDFYKKKSNTQYYKIGEDGEWIQYENAFLLYDYNLIEENKVSEDGNITIFAKNVDKNNKETIVEKDFSVNLNATTSAFEEESLAKFVSNDWVSNGYYSVQVNGEIYTLHVYEYNGNQEWSENMTFGDEGDVATSDTYASNMVVVKINGDLTINSNITVTAFNTTYGGPKGMFIYCTGTLTNNGTISMTARGAKAVGQNVYLYKNADETYEYIPATGGAGAGNVKRSSDGTTSGKTGGAGRDRGTGGGGSGGASSWANANSYSGSGTSGTSYSGGTGGGACSSRSGTNYAGSGAANGGAGGYGKTKRDNSTNYQAGGGAGNPGGMGHYNNAQNASYKGSNGTGGLLIIYGNNIINTGSITSNGSTGGGTTYHSAGGSSGAGSINIFYKNEYNSSGTITANSNKNATGGAGGTGSITVGNFLNGTFNCTYKNY